MEVMALSVKLKEEGAATVESAMKKLKLSTLAASLSIGTTLTLAIRKLVTETSIAQSTQAQLANALKATGSIAGQTLDALNAHASALQSISTYGDDAIGQAQARLLSYTGIVGDAFPRATEVVLDYAAAFNTDLVQASEAVGKALNYPTQGLGMLSKQGFIFTDVQKEQIKYFEDTNQLAKAQTIIFEELESVTKGAAAAQRDTLGGALSALSNAWGDLFEVSRDSSQGIINLIESITATLPKLRNAINETFLEWQVLTTDVQIALAKTAAALAKSNMGLSATAMAFSRNAVGLDTFTDAAGRLAIAQQTIADLEVLKLKRQQQLARANTQVAQTQTAVAGALGATNTALTQTAEALAQAQADAAQKAKEYRDNLAQLAGLTALTRGEYNALVAAEKAVAAEIAKGNLPLGDRIALMEQHERLAVAVADATIKLTESETLAQYSSRLSETAFRRTADSVQSYMERIKELRREIEKKRLEDKQRQTDEAVARTGISADIPAPVAAKDLYKNLRNPIREQTAQLAAEIQKTVSGSIANGLQDGLTAGIMAAVSSGRIADAWKAMSQAIIQNLASAMVEVALVAIGFAAKMKAIRDYMVLNPTLAVAAAAAMLAFAYANGGKSGPAKQSFSGGMGGGGYTVAGAGVPTNNTVTRTVFGPTSATTAAGMTPRQPMNVTIIGPDDPKAQRAIQELIAKGNTRGVL